MRSFKMNPDGLPQFDWTAPALEAAALCGTPCYLFSWQRVLHALNVLNSLQGPVPTRHWLSLKSQPMRRLVREWRALNAGIEVVSRFELLAALHEGFPPEQILVNGVGKHRWLSDIAVPELRVHFDSLEETTQLAATAARHGWRAGLRFALRKQVDPDEPIFSTQFGLSATEACAAVRALRLASVSLESAHFHLRSNVPTAIDYADALAELTLRCQEAGFSPRFVDCGGGLPCPGDDLTRDLKPTFDLAEFAKVVRSGIQPFPNLEEMWLENGRFLTGRAGVLVLRVVDIKDRSECRYVICDGGRTNHALVSDWEQHHVYSIPPRSGQERLMTLCGPTCMAFDRLCRCELPDNLQIGDLVVWQNAGAYHIPWETRFSHGLAPVVWLGLDGTMSLARERETFSQWWGER
jgi:diaminopimelate decarboxylase